MSLTERIKLLNGATATGASGTGLTQGAGDGAIFQLMFPKLAAAVQAEIFGSPTACVINIMGLIDGVTWDTLAVLDITQGYASGEVQALTFPAPITQIKANLSSLTNGASVSCYFAAIG